MTLWQDIRFASRLLVKDRWFTLVAATALALGIGVNTTVFTFVNAVLIRGLPFENPERIMWVGTRDGNANGRERGLSFTDFEDWRDQQQTFDGLVLWGSYAFNMSEAGRDPDRFTGVYISTNIFRMIGEQPILGRDFVADDERPGAPPVLIISHGLWQSRYGGDPNVLGRTVTINAFSPTIIGVMAPDLRFPANNDLWVPLVHIPAGVRPLNRDARNFPVFGLLKEGITIEQATADLTGIANRLANDFPATNKNIRPYLMTFSERQNGGEIRLVFLSLMGAVGFVLLIAIANVANLLLARAAFRTREMSVRVSLGASRWRIVRQLLVESVMLAAISGLAGYGLAVVGVRLFDAATQNVGKPSWIHFTMDGSVFGFLAVITLLTGVLFGLAPALHVSRTNVNDVLKEGGRTGAAGVRVRWWTSILIVGELALTLVLLAGAGFMMRSFLMLYRQEVGIDVAPIVTATISMPDRKYHENDQRVAFFRRLEERLNTINGVEAATVASSAPGLGGGARGFAIEGRPEQAGTQAPMISTVSVGPRYFDTIGVRMLRGRALVETDGLPGQDNIVVNQRFVAMNFPNEDPIGRRIGFTEEGPGGTVTPPASWLTIVGVAPTVRQRSMRQSDTDPVVYLSNRFQPGLNAGVLVRSRAGAAAVTPLLRAELRSIDSDLPLFQIQTLEAGLARQRWEYTIFGSMFAFFAFIALLLSAVGLYAVTAYSVTQRTQEIGVRMALGAQTSQVLWLFVRRVLVHLAIGLALGLAGAVAVGRLLQGVLVRTSATDPATLASIVGVLVSVAVIAAFWPARRAARLDPVIALRYE
jgi:predicted permease